MKAQMQIPMKPAAAPAPPLFTPGPFGTLQRKCACGGSAGSGGDCEECKKKKQTLQRRAISSSPGPPASRDLLSSLLPGPQAGHDFGRIRVQAEGKPAESNQWQPRCGQFFPAPSRLPVLSDAPKEIEAGHTECDWDRNVKGDEPFIPKSGNAKVKIITDDPCTKDCTVKHEATHVAQVKPLCQTYFDCYTQAPTKAASSDLCKGMTGGDLKHCQDLVTQMLRAECFIAVGNAWNAQKWECEGYKVSLSCAEGLLAKATPDCKAKIEQYRDSAKQQIAKYCAAAK